MKEKGEGSLEMFALSKLESSKIWSSSDVDKTLNMGWNDDLLPFTALFLLLSLIVRPPKSRLLQFCMESKSAGWLADGTSPRKPNDDDDDDDDNDRAPFNSSNLGCCWVCWIWNWWFLAREDFGDDKFEEKGDEYADLDCWEPKVRANGSSDSNIAEDENDDDDDDDDDDIRWFGWCLSRWRCLAAGRGDVDRLDGAEDDMGGHEEQGKSDGPPTGIELPTCCCIKSANTSSFILLWPLDDEEEDEDDGGGDDIEIEDEILNEANKSCELTPLAVGEGW